MKKGQIIRRMLNNGVPVGAYMRIVGFTHNSHVIAQKIGEIEECMLLRQHVYEPKHVKLIISQMVYDRLRLGYQHSIIHDICPTWLKMMDIQPDIVEIKMLNYPQKLQLFRVDQVRFVYYGREKQLRLDLGERII